MVGRAHTVARWLLWALPIWALMLLLSVMTKQPDPQSQFREFAQYVTTSQFLTSHLINSILGAAIGSVGFVGLFVHLSDSRAAGRALAATIAMVAGNTLTTAVFGAAAFTQPALGRAFLDGNRDALALYNDVYSVPLFGTAVLGLLLFIAGGILAGLAVAASHRFPRWAGWLLAVSIPVFAVGSLMAALLAQAGAVGALLATFAIAWSGARHDYWPMGQTV
ncbi:MAG TPA: hypothetical protein VK929_02185 [Longimicrobiales bacterium]|nr:hypothetical protein [Longimicrobiales bacterium]